MALTAIQADGVVSSGGSYTLTIAPASGEEWNIELRIYITAAGTTVSFNGTVILSGDAGAALSSKHILTNTNQLSIVSNSKDFNYYYSGYKKT